MPEKIIQLNETVIKSEQKDPLRGSVEETLNELLEAEAQKLTWVARYECNEQRPLQPQPYYHFRGHCPQGAQAQRDLL